MGHPGFRAPLPAQAGGHVAAGDRGGSGTLDLLAQAGIKFTILSPYQASHVRPVGGRAWRDVSGGRIDPPCRTGFSCRRGGPSRLFLRRTDFARHRVRGPARTRARTWRTGYVARSPNRASGRSSSTSPPTARPTATIARHGDMALAYALDCLESSPSARLTNYGEFLRTILPTTKSRIFERSSWSCVHGVERWKARLRLQFRHASRLAPALARAPARGAGLAAGRTGHALRENAAASYSSDPWAARDDYISVVLDRPGSWRTLSSSDTRRIA